MKKLTQFIKESIKELPKNKKGIIVFDIDDTLIHTNSKDIKIYKKLEDGKEIPLSTSEFAKDPDASNPSFKGSFDMRDFRTPQKVYNSIVNGTPIIKNLKILDSYVQAGYDFCFLTARGCEDVVKQAIGDFLKVRDNNNNNLIKVGNVYKKSLSKGVNDEWRHYKGKSDAEKKGNVLKNLCKKYDKVVFVDDDLKNIKQAKELGFNNLMVIQANKYTSNTSQKEN